MLILKDDYISSIDAVIHFLQGKNSTLADSIVQDGYLPEASHFSQLDDLEWAFGATKKLKKIRKILKGAERAYAELINYEI